ncbi:SH3 domain-containing protein [bacterium]|nr:SH3 domain-containing protein [bacterium]
MKVINAIIAGCIVFSVFLNGLSSAQVQTKLVGAPEIVPPATEAMQHPEFWISRIDGDPDKVFLTPLQIKELNRKNHTRPPERTDINGAKKTFAPVLLDGNFAGICFNTEDPLAIRSITGDSLRVWLGRTRKYLESGDFWDRRQILYPAARKRELIESMDETSIPAVVKPQYGIVVVHTLNRIVPTHEKVYRSQYGWLDGFQNAVFETGMPVAVLHRTKNGDWYYVKSEYAFGWVPASSVATGTVEEIRRLSDPDDFIVALAHTVPVYGDRGCKTWARDFYQGVRLRLVKKTVEGYEILVPFRRADGTLEAVPGWVKPDADVSVGFQPFTQRNIITTIFKLLNRPYGWGGTDHERDCVGTIRSVYRTFGINMSRMTYFELYFPDNVIVFPADTPKEVKYRYLDSCPPAVTVCGFDWHVVMYLGKVDGVHYIIHQNGYSYHDTDGTEIRVGRVSVNHTELEGGADINRWTELAVFK